MNPVVGQNTGLRPNECRFVPSLPPPSPPTQPPPPEVGHRKACHWTPVIIWQPISVDASPWWWAVSQLYTLLCLCLSLCCLVELWGIACSHFIVLPMLHSQCQGLMQNVSGKSVQFSGISGDLTHMSVALLPEWTIMSLRN